MGSPTLPAARIHFPDIALSDYHLFGSMTHGLSKQIQAFSLFEDTKKWVDS